MDKEHLQIIGELYTEAHRMRFLLQQSQAQVQQLEQKLAEYQQQVQALESELENSRTTITQFKAIAGTEQDNEAK